MTPNLPAIARDEAARSAAAARRHPTQPMLGLAASGVRDAAGHGALDEYSVAANRWRTVADLIERIQAHAVARPHEIRIVPAAAPAAAFVLAVIDRAIDDGADDARLSALYAIDKFLLDHAARAGDAPPRNERKAA